MPKTIIWAKIQIKLVSQILRLHIPQPEKQSFEEPTILLFLGIF